MSLEGVSVVISITVPVSVLVSVHDLSDPAVIFPHIGVDPGYSLRGAAHPPADHPGQTGLSTVLDTDQGTTGVSLTGVLEQQHYNGHWSPSPFPRPYLVLPARTEHGVGLLVPGVAGQHLVTDVGVQHHH